MSAIYHKCFLLLLILSPLLRQTATPLWVLTMLIAVSLSFLSSFLYRPFFLETYALLSPPGCL